MSQKDLLILIDTIHSLQKTVNIGEVECSKNIWYLCVLLMSFRFSLLFSHCKICTSVSLQSFHYHCDISLLLRNILRKFWFLYSFWCFDVFFVSIIFIDFFLHYSKYSCGLTAVPFYCTIPLYYWIYIKLHQ